jgi:hypothetical protein
MLKLKLNIGFNRKVGEANFGSRGASVNLEIEVESGLVREPDKLQAKIGYLFELAKASVESQLNDGAPPQQQQPATNGNGANGNGTHASAGVSQSQNAGNGNGHHTQASGSSSGSGHNGHSNGNGHQASEKQMTYVRQLAGHIKGLGVRRLEALAQKMFCKPVAGLTSLEASGLIDTLKGIKAGDIDLDAVLGGAATP